jgi:hypothetical protein
VLGIHHRNELLRGARLRCRAEREEYDGKAEVFCHQAWRLKRIP